MLLLKQQGSNPHGHTGLAIAALRDFRIESRLLHTVEHHAISEALDHGDVCVLSLADRQDAGRHSGSVYGFPTFSADIKSML